MSTLCLNDLVVYVDKCLHVDPKLLLNNHKHQKQLFYHQTGHCKEKCRHITYTQTVTMSYTYMESVRIHSHVSKGLIELRSTNGAAVNNGVS